MGKVSFRVEKRKNCFAPRGHEWAFNVSFGGDTWTVCTWDHEPSTDEVAFAKNITVRSFEIYHSTLRISPFSMEIING